MGTPSLRVRLVLAAGRTRRRSLPSLVIADNLDDAIARAADRLLTEQAARPGVCIWTHWLLIAPGHEDIPPRLLAEGDNAGTIWRVDEHPEGTTDGRPR